MTSSNRYKQHPFAGLSPKEVIDLVRSKALIPVGDELNRRYSEEADRDALKGPRSNTVALVWDIDKTAMRSYQQDQFFATLRRRQIEGGMEPANAVDADKFWDLVHEQQASERAHPHRRHSTEQTCLGLLLYLSKKHGWEITNDDMLSLGTELKFAENFLELNERIKRLGAALNLNVEIYAASGGWRRYMLPALSGTILLNGKPQPIFDDSWGIEFSSRSGRDNEPMRRSATVVSAPEKVEVLDILASGANVWPDRIGTMCTREARRIDLIGCCGDGITDGLMFGGSKVAFGVSYEGDLKQRERMLALEDSEILSAAIEADFSKFGPAEAAMFRMLFDFADEITKQRSFTGERNKAAVVELATHPGTTRDRLLTPHALSILHSSAYTALGTEQQNHVDAIALFRYATQMGALIGVEPKDADVLAGTDYPEKLTILIPRSAKNDGPVRLMLSRLKGRDDRWSPLENELPKSAGEEFSFNTIYGDICIRRSELSIKAFGDSLATNKSFQALALPVLGAGTAVGLDLAR